MDGDGTAFFFFVLYSPPCVVPASFCTGMEEEREREREGKKVGVVKPEKGSLLLPMLMGVFVDELSGKLVVFCRLM